MPPKSTFPNQLLNITSPLTISGLRSSIIGSLNSPSAANSLYSQFCIPTLHPSSTISLPSPSPVLSNLARLSPASPYLNGFSSNHHTMPPEASDFEEQKQKKKLGERCRDKSGMYFRKYEYPKSTVISFIHWKTDFLAGREGSHHDWPVASRSRTWTRYLDEHWSRFPWAKDHPKPTRDICRHWMKHKNFCDARSLNADESGGGGGGGGGGGA